MIKSTMTTDITCRKCSNPFTQVDRLWKPRVNCYTCAPVRIARWGQCATCTGRVRIDSRSKPEGEARCRPCQRANLFRECAFCELLFRSRRYVLDGETKWTVTCSRECGVKFRYSQTEIQGDRARNAMKCAKRQAVLINQKREIVLPVKVFIRDNWTCALCNGSVDSSFEGRHPKAPSLDHIIPLSKGGPHSYENVQLAHYGCNSRKGNRNV
jgi:5-methylcytosine-specific restriction endonuclease McrA